MTVLPIAYFPPISYISLLAKGDVCLEACENYQKQSWRNRCNILTANGVESLTVPVVHAGGTYRHPIAEIEIDYGKPWLQHHKRAIDSAYMSSAFFEHYRDGLYSILDTRPSTLWNLDCAILDFFIKAYRLPSYSITTEYSGLSADIHPKHIDKIWAALESDYSSSFNRPYYQVFSHKFAFVPNLSVMDLLFNEGPSFAFR